MHEVPATPWPSPASVAAPADYPVRFLGTGSEYFRIWIVNLLLTIVTLGIYSAWAKVRRLKYMYRNTQIADSSFDYHGSAIVIDLDYSRAMEREADLYAVDLLRANGISTGSLATLFERMQKAHDKRGAKSDWPTYLSTHPPTPGASSCFESRRTERVPVCKISAAEGA